MLRILLPLVLMLTGFVGTGGVIHACVRTDSGAVRIVSADTLCTAEESKLEWGIVGIQGPVGPQGIPGAQGAAGAQGPAGVGDLGCTTNQVIKWDDVASQWLCSDELVELQSRLTALESLLANVSRNGNNLVISGANLQVVNGLGKTDSANSLGNIIIGYNEERTETETEGFRTNERSGSHMLVVGTKLNYTKFGGIVVGYANSATGIWSSVSGGSYNRASGNVSSISGGWINRATNNNASISGGYYNLADGYISSVCGGELNTASGEYASVSGGKLNVASGTHASVSGGGYSKASGESASVSGGFGEQAEGDYDWQAGDSMVSNQ